MQLRRVGQKNARLKRAARVSKLARRSVIEGRSLIKVLEESGRFPRTTLSRQFERHRIPCLTHENL